MDVDPTGNGNADGSNYWSSYYHYPYNAAMDPSQGYNVDPNQSYYLGYPGWGSAMPPGFQPPPPSQPPPPPPDDDQPPPPPSDSKPPSPKRPKTESSDSENLPRNFPPPPPGLMPPAMPPIAGADTDKYGYYDSSSSASVATSVWNTGKDSSSAASVATSVWNTGKDAKLTRTFAQVVQGKAASSPHKQQGNSYQNNKRPYPETSHQDRSKLNSDNKEAKREHDYPNKNRGKYPDHSSNSRYSDTDLSSNRYNNTDHSSNRYNNTEHNSNNRYNDTEHSSNRHNPMGAGDSSNFRYPDNRHNGNIRFNDNANRYNDASRPQGKDTNKPSDQEYSDNNRGRYSDTGFNGTGNNNQRYSDNKYNENTSRYDDRSNKQKPAGPPQSAGVAPSEWPQSLRDYVKRCFSNCSSDQEKDATEQFLKNRLKTTHEDRFIWETDWDNEPSPFGAPDRLLKHRNSPQKVGFSLNRNRNFQPRQNVFQSQKNQPDRSGGLKNPFQNQQDRSGGLKNPPQNQQDRSPKNPFYNGDQSSAGSQDSPFASPRNLKSRVGPKKAGLFKPGDDTAEQNSDGAYKPQARRGGFNSFMDTNQAQQNAIAGLANNNSNNNNNNMRGRGRGGRGGRGGGRGRGRGRGFDNNQNKNKMKNKIGLDNEKAEGSSIGDVNFDTAEKKEGRANRFKKENLISVSDTISSMMESANKLGGEDVHFSDVHIVGTSNALEKPYLRLTSAPTADQVRPEHVLVKSLSHVMQKWKKEQNYAFVCEQLKSIRQDLTIQAIKNPFAVKVYECHARIAMEKMDTTEYNQCQTRLIDLYRACSGCGNPLEFLAYRILYYIYINNTSDAIKLIASLQDKHRNAEVVNHAIDVFNAWSSGNYLRFFRLYIIAPLMGGYLMDAYVQRERTAALKKIVKAYKPSISIVKICELIGYPDTETALVFLEEVPVVFTNANKSIIDCKKTLVE